MINIKDLNRVNMKYLCSIVHALIVNINLVKSGRYNEYPSFNSLIFYFVTIVVCTVTHRRNNRKLTTT